MHRCCVVLDRKAFGFSALGLVVGIIFLNLSLGAEVTEAHDQTAFPSEDARKAMIGNRPSLQSRCQQKYQGGRLSPIGLYSPGCAGLKAGCCTFLVTQPKQSMLGGFSFLTVIDSLWILHHVF